MFDKYFTLANPNVEIQLKNGRVIHGIIVGYYFTDTENQESPIHHWRVMDCRVSVQTGFNEHRCNKGECIRHGDIASVTFEEDRSELIVS